jgi:hypothetical protein
MSIKLFKKCLSIVDYVYARGEINYGALMRDSALTVKSLDVRDTHMFDMISLRDWSRTLTDEQILEINDLQDRDTKGYPINNVWVGGERKTINELRYNGRDGSFQIEVKVYGSKCNSWERSYEQGLSFTVVFIIEKFDEISSKFLNAAKGMVLGKAQDERIRIKMIEEERQEAIIISKMLSAAEDF